MTIPFSKEDFFEIFASYNNAIFPMQFFLIAIALVSVFIVLKGNIKYKFVVPATLAFLWAWMGIAYHIMFFSQINPVAKLFGFVFVIQSVIFIFVGLVRKDLNFVKPKGFSLYLSITLLIYAFLIYPLITIRTGHTYPSMPTFGLPCPTTIYTFGILLLTDLKKLPKYVIVIPASWAIIGSTAAFKLGIVADTMLFISLFGFLGTIYIKKKTTL